MGRTAGPVVGQRPQRQIEILFQLDAAEVYTHLVKCYVRLQELPLEPYLSSQSPEKSAGLLCGQARAMPVVPPKVEDGRACPVCEVGSKKLG